MLRRTSILSLLMIVIVLPNYTAEAASQVKSAANASQGFRCSIANEYSFPESGSLFCLRGKWTQVQEPQDTVATRAFRSLLIRYAKGADSEPNLILRIDPAAGEWKNGIVGAMNVAARLWGTSSPSDKPVPIYVSETGRYISENLKADGLTESSQDAQRNKEAAERGGGQAGFHGPYFDFIFSKISSTDTGFYQAGAHEYTHYSQMIFSNQRIGQLPTEFWINEGCASYIGVSMSSFAGFPQNSRSKTVSDFANTRNQAPLSFYSKGNSSLYSNQKFNQIFDKGFFACEALVALNGVDSQEQYFRALSVDGATPENVFPTVFGASMSSYIGMIQKYVNSVYAGKPLNLSQLQTQYAKIKLA